MKLPKYVAGGAVLTLALVLAISILPVSALFSSQSQVDEVPAIATFAKNTTVDSAITFSPTDFVAERGDDTLDAIVISALPDPCSGVLTVGNMTLSEGDVVAVSALNGLTFSPLSTPTVATTSFSFTPVFADAGYSDDVSVDLYLLTAPNSGPVAQNLSFTTYKNIAVTERFSAVDPEGDLLTFQITDKPARGAVTMPSDGSTAFVYTPYENKSGKDSFTYVAVDSVGNVSPPATVSIVIEKSPTTMTYADMDGHWAHRDALRLAGSGIFVGASMNDIYLFEPEASVSRSEFVTVAMDALGMDSLSTVQRTGFADDEAIATWAKPYLAAALQAGVVQGYVADNGQVVFAGDDTITRAEATVLLDRMLAVSDVVSAPPYTDSESAPVWAMQSAANLEAVGVIATDDNGALSLHQQLTRSDMAQMLAAAMDVVEARNSSSSWFHW